MSRFAARLKTMFRFGSVATKPAPGARPSQPGGEDTDFRMLAENSIDVICRITAEQSMVYASPSVEKVFGWTAKEMIDQAALLIIDERDLPIIADVHSRLMAGEDEIPKVSYRAVHKDGRRIWVEANARMVRDPVTGAQGDIVITMRDISDRKRLEEQLRALSLTDGLTGLYNRRAFDENLEREWQRTAREGSQMSLLLLDLDRFKKFNDLYGHQAGDDCLRVVAATINQSVRQPGDIAARYGGEELAVILPNTDGEGAETIAESIRAGIESLALRHAGNSGFLCVTASIGVATAFARVGGTMKMPESLLQAADVALYKAKEKGRNRVAATIVMAAQSDAAAAPG